MLHTVHSFLSALFHQSHYHTEVSCQPMRLNTWDFLLDSSYCDLHHSGSQENASLKLHPCIVTNHDFIFLAKKCLQPVTLHGSSWVNNMGSGHVHVHPGTGVTWHSNEIVMLTLSLKSFISQSNYTITVTKYASYTFFLVFVLYLTILHLGNICQCILISKESKGAF